GTFAELTPMANWDNGAILEVLGPGGINDGYITQYADNAGWDPVNERFMFYGAQHGNFYLQGFVIYMASDNTWRRGPLHPDSCSGQTDPPCFSHAYDHNAVDPAPGDLYYREYVSAQVYRYAAPNGPWSLLPPVPEDVVRTSGNCCGGV